MKYLIAAALVAGTFASFSAANAAGGCGLGFHRGPYGGCRPNGGAVVVAPRVVRPPVVVVPRGRICPLRFPHNGKLSCFFIGISTCLSFSIASARAMRRRVECGMMTSSI